MADIRFERVIAATDAANAEDPYTVHIRGTERPKELAHAELMTAWVQRLCPEASDLQLIGARAHHVQRWTIPRSDYDEGRAGYLRWRTALKRMHSRIVGELMADAGYADDEITRVRAIVEKRNLASDPEVQVHEDALCLVFIETQFADLAGRLDDAKLVDVTRKTLKKMSPAAIELALGLDLTSEHRDLIVQAL